MLKQLLWGTQTYRQTNCTAYDKVTLYYKERHGLKFVAVTCGWVYLWNVVWEFGSQMHLQSILWMSTHLHWAVPLWPHHLGWMLISGLNRAKDLLLLSKTIPKIRDHANIKKHKQSGGQTSLDEKKSNRSLCTLTVGCWLSDCLAACVSCPVWHLVNFAMALVIIFGKRIINDETLDNKTLDLINWKHP